MPRAAQWVGALTCVIGTAAAAMAADCPPPTTPEVYFVTRVDYFFDDGSFNPANPDGSTSLGAGMEMTWTADTTRTLPSIPSTAQRRLRCSGFAADNSISALVSTTTDATAGLAEPLYAGGAQTLVVDVYVRGPVGTPFFVNKQVDGILMAIRNPGGGTETNLHAYYQGQLWNGPQTRIIDDNPPMLIGNTSSATPPGGPAEYKYATTVTVNLGGHAFHPGFCFFGCPTYRYQTEATASLSLTAGVGAPPCTGKLTAPIWTTNCVEGDNGVGRGFRVHAEMSGAGATGCSCCEYRQYVRRSRVSRNIVYRAIGAVASTIFSQRSLDRYDKSCDGWVQDNGWDHNTIPSTAYPGYGHRSSPDKPTDRYSGGASRASSCTYDGRDFPAAPYSSKYYIEFEGRIVAKANCGGTGNQETIVDRKRWTFCCESGDNGAQECSMPRIDAIDCVSRSDRSEVSNRDLYVQFGRRDNLVVGVVSLGAMQGEAIPSANLGVTIDGTLVDTAEDATLGLTSNDYSAFAEKFIAFRSDCVPASIPVRISFGGEEVIVTVDTSAISTMTADFNADTVVDLFDYLDFVSVFAAGTIEADFNGDTVVDFFDYLDFVAAFSSGC